MAGCIMYFVILCLVALIMAGIGISQVRSRKPVGFYTGVKPPEEKNLRDVKAWNRKHGIMWILYGCAVMGCGLAHLAAGILGYDAVFPAVIAECGIIIGGIFAMMWYHVRLEKRYRC